jgi:hypothetical protein
VARAERALAAGTVLSCLLALGGCGGDEPVDTVESSCEARSVADEHERFSAGEVAVHVEASGGDNLALARADLESTLSRLWGETVSVRDGAPSGSERAAIWLTTSAEATAEVGAPPADGYLIRRVEAAGGPRIVVHGADETSLVFGAYALLEELGVRFFHPKQELIPELGAPHLPRSLELGRKPAFGVRGVQLHLLHPTEYFRPFNEPSPENLEDAKRFIDWLVKTGQNHVQWWLLRTMDLEAHRPHRDAIIAYAHSRGVTAGAVAQLWGGASLQNSYDLIRTKAGWQAELEAGLDGLLESDWDLVELGLGEFLAGNPDELVQWLDHATSFVHEKHPGVELSVVNHVGNYPNLWVDYQGAQRFFYHMPGFADQRLINNVHTVLYFDLYRDWGAYGHPDFSLQRDFLKSQITTRKLRYLPESAYWVTADIDVPVFLPMYAYARWLDINGLVEELAALGLPPLDGHVMFSSGHEWGYWLIDYLSAKQMWAPEQPFSELLADYARAYGSCSQPIARDLGALIDVQNQYLFDQKLAPYVHGEDGADDIGELVGITTHPPRVRFEALLAMSADERALFERDTLEPVELAASEIGAIEQRFERTCRRVDDALRSWCSELEHGTRIVRLRLEHSAALYRAVLDSVRGGSSAARWLERAGAIRQDAKLVIDARALDYRWDQAHLVESWSNPTIYDFGYLRQAHQLCYWERQRVQAQSVIDDGVPALIGALPSCMH